MKITADYASEKSIAKISSKGGQVILPAKSE
jgi:hypothetical protein